MSILGRFFCLLVVRVCVSFFVTQVRCKELGELNCTRQKHYLQIFKRVGMLPGCCLEAAGTPRIIVTPERQNGWDHILTKVRFSCLNFPMGLRIGHIKGRACEGGLVHIALVFVIKFYHSQQLWNTAVVGFSEMRNKWTQKQLHGKRAFSRPKVTSYD